MLVNELLLSGGHPPTVMTVVRYLPLWALSFSCPLPHFVTGVCGITPGN